MNKNTYKYQGMIKNTREVSQVVANSDLKQMDQEIWLQRFKNEEHLFFYTLNWINKIMTSVWKCYRMLTSVIKVLEAG